MQYRREKDNNTEMEISTFVANDVEESHLMVKALNNDTFWKQLENTHSFLQKYFNNNNLCTENVMLTRFFVSDCANQSQAICDFVKQKTSPIFNNCAISIVQQPPLNTTKLVLWIYLIKSTKTKIIRKKNGTEFSVNGGAYKHIWSTQLTTTDNTVESYQQTQSIFKNFDADLKKQGLTLKENCIRTWLYVKDVDSNYSGVVEARKEFFNELGMTKDTHFISSTGIEGRHINPQHNVLMDAYSVGGLRKEQVKFLTATDYLNPTHEYGVTFERGTSINYGDRRHIFLSGTASIDNKGEVVHSFQIEKQIGRTLDNIIALLKDADAKMDDVAHLIIYLRDIADREVVNKYFKYYYSDIPKVIVLAPVCRPGWLIEMECIAIKKIENKKYLNF